MASLRRDSTVIEATLTDSMGQFQLSPPPMHSIIVRHVAYQPTVLQIDSLSPNCLLAIELIPRVNSIGDVRVAGQGHITTGRGETIIITDSLRLGTNSISMLLERIQGIRIDALSQKLREGLRITYWSWSMGSECPWSTP